MQGAADPHRLLQAAGLALHKQKHTMRVPRSQRGGDIVEPMVRDQWFVRAQPLAEPALQVSLDIILAWWSSGRKTGGWWS